MDVGLELPRGCSLQEVEHLRTVGGGKFATTQTTNDVDHGWPLRTIVEGGAERGVQHAPVMGGAKAVVAIDDGYAFEAAQAFNDVFSREWAEPFEASETNLVSLLAQPAHNHPARHGNGSLTD